MPSMFHLTFSAVVHAVIAALILFGMPQVWPESPADEPPDEQDQSQVAESELVDEQSALPVPEANPDESASAEESPLPQAGDTAVTPTEPNSTQLDFAGAPPPPPSPSRRESPAPAAAEFGETAEAEVSEDVPSVAKLDLDPADRASDAEFPLPAYELNRDGINAPSFHVLGLTVQQMEQIVSAKQGTYAVFDEHDRARYVVRGSIREPNEVSPPSTRDHQLSQRALPVPRESCAGIFDRIKWDFAVPTEDLDRFVVRLVFANPLDQLVYDRQRQAVSNIGKHLDDASLTVGNLKFVDSRVQDFRVTMVILRDGTRVPVVPNGTSTN